MQVQPPPKPRGIQFQSRREIRELTNISKNLYNQFHLYELEESRLSKLDLFIQLIGEIQHFNNQLVKWKKNQHEIKNLIVTYHLYENLFSRLMYISNFCKNQQESIAALQKTIEWFHVEKPKMRCQVKDTNASIKKLSHNEVEVERIDKMIQSNSVKRQLQPYQLMSRTAHPGLFPPKQRLKQYKRKQFLPFTTGETQLNPKSAKKSSSASLLSKNRLSKFRMSVGTLMTTSASMRQTSQNFKNAVTQFKIDNIPQENKIQIEVENQQAKQEQQKQLNEILDQAQRQKKVQKQQILQQNIVQKLGEEDGPDAQDQNIFQDEEVKNPKKNFVVDHDPEEIQYAKQLIKQNDQSTLRRVMKINQQKIRSKLQDLDIKRNMMIWSKTKGNNKKEESRKLQGFLNCNKYNEVAFKKKSMSQLEEHNDGNNRMSSTTGFSNYKNPQKQPTMVQMLYRSKSSHQTTLQSDIQKLRIRETINTYGRYINHLPVRATPEQIPEQDQRKRDMGQLPNQLRSMSLTNLSSLVAKKKHFSSIIQSNNPYEYNQQAQEEILRIKNSLSKKQSSIQKGAIYKALSIVPPLEIQPRVGFYTAGRDLLSNPFFPKNLGKKRKKK